MKSLQLLSLASFCLLATCHSSGLKAPGDVLESRFLVLSYEDFGPPSMAYELIGADWWQWQPHGDSRPRDYGIRVVVHRKDALADAKERYPVDREKEQDFRYLCYVEALAYLDAGIAENALPELTEKLANTRKTIRGHFGDR